MRRLNTHDAKYQSESRNRNVPKPTITSHARCTTSTSAFVGRAFFGNESRPWICVLVPSAGSERIDARPGMGIPPSTSPWSFRCPNNVSGTSVAVFGTISMAANFTGSLL